MANCRLRIYNGPEDCGSSLPSPVDVGPSPTVTVPLGDVISSLADAIKNNRMWLRDFENDEVTIPSDLYDVMLAYQDMRRSSA
ncbi:MAG: hypothetical protein KDB27_33945 [Planctomycetales bacterium]|nr:hypothetical protein [Planctomycetales bacterium]